MNISYFYQRKIPDFFAMLFIATAFYVPLILFSLNLASDQIVRGVDSRYTLPVYGSDSVGYVNLADNLLENHVFSHYPKSYNSPETYRTPMYPLLLAGWKAIFGSFTLFPLLQILFVVGTSFLMLRIGEKIFTRKIGFVAAFLYMFDPTTVFHAMVILSEISYVFFIVLSVWLFFFCAEKYAGKRAWRLIFFAGLTLGFATLIRPISMFLPVALFPVYVWREHSRLEWKSIIGGYLIFVFGLSLVVFPWALRNRVATGTWGISSVASFALFYYYVPEFLAYKKGTTPDIERIRMIKELPKEVKESDPGLIIYSELLQNLALQNLSGNFIAYGRFHLFKTIPVFLSSGIKNAEASYNDIVGYRAYTFSTANATTLLLKGKFSEFFSELRISPSVTIEMLILTAIFCLSLVALLPSKTRFHVCLFWVLVLYFSLLTGTSAYCRFRLPISPFLFLLASFGVTIFWSGAGTFITRLKQRTN